MQTRHLVSAAALALMFCAPGAFAVESCRTLVNGIQKCDVQTGSERTREDVVADMHASHADTSTGCRTLVNGIQKCDVQNSSAPAVVATTHGGAMVPYDGCHTIVNGIQKCDVPAGNASTGNTAVAKLH